MNEENLKLRLAETIANIEQRTDNELVSIIKDTLTAVGTGYLINNVNEQYKIIYDELDKRLNAQKISNPNNFDDLWEFYNYWGKNDLNTYASRRSFVRNLYKVQSMESGPSSDVWSTLHPVIVSVAKSRFDSGHYADAVEASYKEINSRIKEEVRQRTGKTYDGANLMNQAFSVNNPIIVLEDLESEDGQNVQNGYMMMFSGAMIAIRNPKAHSNNSIEPDEAMPLIQIASHLFSKFDAAISRNKVNEDNEELISKAKGLYVRIKDPDNHEKLLGLKKIALNYPGKKAMILVLGEEKRSAIRLPFTVDDSDKHISELKKLLGEKNVVKK